MQFKANEVVSIQHYSGSNLFKSIVLDSNGHLLVIRLPEGFVALNYFEEDPVVLGFVSNEKANIANCTILSINVPEETIMLEVEDVESIDDKRIYERFPVSFYADFETNSLNKKHTAIVKNISLFGLGISTKPELEKGHLLSLELYLDQKVVPVTAEVMWRKQKDYNYDYGLKLDYNDVNSKNTIKHCIETLKKEQEDFIAKIKL